MTVVSADLGLLPDADVLRPRVWIGDTLVVRVQFRDEARKPVEPPGPVVFLWKSPSNVVLELPGVAVAGKVGAYNCEYQVPTTGLWAVRAEGGDGQPLEWTEVTVVPEPPVGSIPQQSIWLSAVGTAAVSMRGTHLAGATIPQFPAKATLEATDTIPGVDADGNSVRLPGNAVIDAALATVAPAVEQVTTAAATVATQAGQVADGLAALPGTIAGELADQVPPAVAAEATAQVAAQVTPKVTQAQAAQTGAQAAQVAAELARDLSAAGANLYASTTAGLAAVAEGATFNVAGAGDTYAITYRKTGGVAVEVARTPSKAALDAVSGKKSAPISDYLMTFEASGNVFGGVRDQGREFFVAGQRFLLLSDGSVRWLPTTGGPSLTLSASGIETDGAVLKSSTVAVRGGSTVGAALEVHYPDGSFSALGIEPTTGVLQLLGRDPVTSAGNTTGSFSSAEVAAYNVMATDYSSRVRRRYAGDLHQPTTDYVLWINYGQSLSFGFQAWPHVTRGPVLDVLMMGQSTRPGGSPATTWAATGGDPTFRALTGASQTRNVPSTLLTDEQMAAMAVNSVDAIDYGEDPLVGAMGELRARWLAAGKAKNVWVASSCGVGGSSTPELSPGATPDNFNRIRGAIDAFKAQVPAGKTWSIGGFNYNQGEQDYIDGTTAEQHAANLAILIQAVRDLAVSKGGQQNGILPVFLIQTGGTWAADNQELGVGRGQVLAAETIPGVFIVTGNAPVPDKGGHLTGNGSRWVGCQTGKAMARVLVNQGGYENARVIQWITREKTLLGIFHGVGKMRFSIPYDFRVGKPVPGDAGVYAQDADGVLSLSNARWVADRVLALDMPRAATAPKVWLGRKSGTSGLTWIADSDPSQFQFPYFYADGLGFEPQDNITALANLYLDASNFVLADAKTAVSA